MIKELSTMALVATMTTTMSTNFEMALGTAKDIVAIYTAAGEHSKDPTAFLNSIQGEQTRLKKFSGQVASLDLQYELDSKGPFGVTIPK